MKALPRLSLAALPTPLRRAERLERALRAPPLWIKREDLAGFALAGNKVRKLEFLVADALERGCDTMLTGGGPGSNHCQATAAAARVAGLACSLVLYGQEPSPAPANLRLARSFGAEVRFTGDPDRASVDRTLEEEAARLAAEGGRPYVVPRGGATALGAVGYALAVEELAGQLAGEGVEPQMVVVATGSCGTQAGLVAGTVGGGHPWRVVGASVSRPPGECRGRVLLLAEECASLLGVPPPRDDNVEVLDARGPGYGVPSAEGAEAADLAAGTEGLLLDPVFTAKAMGALIGMVRQGRDGPLVFIHTGGTTALLEERGFG